MRPGTVPGRDQLESGDEHFAGRTVLVTGGAGFIGSAVCARLARAGAVVHSASRRIAATGAAHRHWRVDLAEATAASELVRSVKPDYVFHLASHVMGAPDLCHVLPSFRSNLQTTVNIMVALAEGGCRRMITTGSLVEPEPGLAGQVPSAPYAAAKWASADYARMFHAVYGLPVAIARVFMVYGPAQQDESKLVPYVIRCVLRGEAPKISSGQGRFDWVFVDDVVSGLLQLAVAPEIDGKTVDLGTGVLTTTAALVERLCELLGSAIRPLYGALADRPLEPVRIARTAETVRLTSWSAQVDLGEGLRRTIEWYRGHPPRHSSDSDLRGSPE